MNPHSDTVSRVTNHLDSDDIDVFMTLDESAISSLVNKIREA